MDYDLTSKESILDEDDKELVSDIENFLDFYNGFESSDEGTTETVESVIDVQELYTRLDNVTNVLIVSMVLFAILIGVACINILSRYLRV